MKCQALTAFRQSRILTSTDLTASPMSRLCRAMIRRRRCAICQGKNASYWYRSARYSDSPYAQCPNSRVCHSVIGPRQQRQSRPPEPLPQDVGWEISRHPPGEPSSYRTPYAGNFTPFDNLNDKRASGGRSKVSFSRLCTFSAPHSKRWPADPFSLYASSFVRRICRHPRFERPGNALPLLETNGTCFTNTTKNRRTPSRTN